jgi:4-hydroxy-3-methylbut-2-enyl diphosphate reductase
MNVTVRLAKNSGFCFGVKRAINLAMDASKNHDKIVTLGSIIHNPQMVNKLKKAGISSVNDIKEIKDQATIIRSHGIPKETYEYLSKLGIDIIDATCPYVSKTQKYAMELSEAGYPIVIMGDDQHPEVIALKSYIKTTAIVIKNADELKYEKFKKVALLSQTTKNIEDFKKIMLKLLEMSEEIRVINTICNATDVRQKSTFELAKESDIMIVVGGKNSSNTKMLAKISGKIIETFHIEEASELKKEWFTNKRRIGITAGASTPDWIIVEVYNKIIEFVGDESMLVEKVEDIPV